MKQALQTSVDNHDIFCVIENAKLEKQKSLIHLSFDPGYKNTAYSIIEQNISTLEFECWEYGMLEIYPGGTDPLVSISTHIQKLIKRLSPASIGIESVFFGTNVSSAVNTSKIIGVIELQAKIHNIVYREVVPTKLKKFITGRGNATKQMMQDSIREKLRSYPKPLDDQTKERLNHIIDAISVGVWVTKEFEKMILNRVGWRGLISLYLESLE